MTEPLNTAIRLITSGFWLVYQLYQTVDKTLVLHALQQKVPLPNVTSVPSWEETEAFITANPDFLNTGERRRWWETLDQTQSRVDLMIALGRELRNQAGACYYLFAPEVRQNTALAPIIMSVVNDIKQVLDDPSLTKDQKFQGIMEILKEAAQ